MNLLLFSSLGLILVSLFHLSVADGDVLELTDANFDSKIRDHEVALVKFYAPWCGHCKRMAPEFDKAAPVLKSNDPPVALIKVDCTVETKICAKHGVSGYPTLKIFKNGEVSSDYNGPREADGIIKYMRTKAGPASKELKSVADAEKFLKVEEHGIIGFFSKADSAFAGEFKKVADQLAENYRFAHTSNPDVLAKYNHKDEVVIYQPPRLQVKLLPTENVYSGAEQSNKIKEFVQEQIHGTVGHRSMSNANDFNKKPLVVVYYNVDYTKDVKGTNYVRNRIIKVAQKLKGEGMNVNFAISNAEEFNNELTEFGFTNVNKDSKLIVGRGAKNEKFKFDGEYSVENLEQFVRDLVAGKLEAFMKSEPIPESNNEAVRTVVGKNFEQVVNDDTKDVLIEFYAPWCGHCKTLAPKYEELAQKLKDEDGLVIAKIDATANDIPPEYEVRGFPTIFFAPKNSKNAPRKYEGGREVDDFIKYLAKESTEPLKNFDRSGKKTKSGKTKQDL
jgi:protein disulfide-isomerase A3